MNGRPDGGCDLLIVSPHTDDLEIGLGGTAALLSGRGRTVWGLDLTRGELGSNATCDERWAEAAEASAVLGLAGRIQLALPDGFIDSRSPEQTAAVAWVVRSLRPRWVATAPDAHRHPDHLETPHLVRRALFMARLAAYQPAPPALRFWEQGARIGPPAETWTCEAQFGVCRDGEEPGLIFDVGAVWEAKVRSLACYRSQFQRGEGRRPTMINDEGFLEKIERRAQAWGRRGGVARGEALCGTAVPVLDDLPAQRWP
ncbi:PIG-L family deacetylase [bacterium]|nr:PIG-L family deacetylase [bacterium]